MHTEDFEVVSRRWFIVLFLASMPILSTPQGLADEDEWKKENEKVIDLFAQGKKQEGIEKMKEVIAMAETKFGQESINVAKSVNNLGNFYFHVGQVDQARESYNRAIEIEKKIQGGDSMIADSYFNLAMTYAINKEHNEAKKLLKSALKYYEKRADENQ